MKNNTSLESLGAATGETPPAPAADQLGKVEISPEAVATIAAEAIMERGYGVVGLASKRLRAGRPEILRPEHYRDGIQVQFEDDQIILELYVIVEYGLRIAEIAHNIMQNVKFDVEKHLGMTVKQVNVNVQGLRTTEQKKQKSS
jgi:uncharacterized alkaline shock family protein YloU